MIASGSRETLKQGLAKAHTAADLLRKIEVDHPDAETALEQFFTGRRKLTEQLDFITLYNGLVDRNNRNRIFVFYDFPEGYAEQIEKLIYPDWYTACFMAECENLSVWANYGDKHGGVCLIFKVKNINGRPTLRLRRPVGFSGLDPIFRDVDHEFHKLRYSRVIRLLISFDLSACQCPYFPDFGTPIIRESEARVVTIYSVAETKCGARIIGITSCMESLEN